MEKNDVQNCWCWWGWELGCTYKLERKEREKKRAARDVRAPFSFLAPGVSSFSGNPAIYSLSLFLFRQQFPPFFYIYFILFYFLLFLFLFGVCTPPHPSSSLDSPARAAMPSFSFQRYRKQPQCDQYHRGAQHWTECESKEKQRPGTRVWARHALQTFHYTVAAAAVLLRPSCHPIHNSYSLVDYPSLRLCTQRSTQALENVQVVVKTTTTITGGGQRNKK
jgi:hypothetical protein